MKLFSEDEIRQRYTLDLPTGYLSYSQLVAWGETEKSKETYRKTYYGGKRFNGNLYTEYGNKVTEAMAAGEEWVAFIPRFSVPERQFIIDVDGIPFKGAIDWFEPGLGAFIEQKTVKNKWSDNKIQKHGQFPCYSLAIELLDGFVQDQAWFLDVRTEEVEQFEEFAGIKLPKMNGAPELQLTGEYNLIPRMVTSYERKEWYEKIVRVGRAIEEDYKAVGHLYKQQNG